VSFADCVTTKPELYPVGRVRSRCLLNAPNRQSS
jgi:hypothetical protein